MSSLPGLTASNASVGPALAGSYLAAVDVVLESVAALNAVGSVANQNNLWPVQLQGTPLQPIAAGVNKVSNLENFTFMQGNFLEMSLGEAINKLQTKKLDLDEKILAYLDMNRLTVDSQLPYTPRVVKLVADSAHFINQIRLYTNDVIAVTAGLQANIALLNMTQTRMTAMIQANLNALANLLQDICNWMVPSLPSLPVLLSGLPFNWSGFAESFEFKFNPALGVNFGFSFSQCSLRSPDFSSVFQPSPASVASGDLTLTQSVTPLLGGTLVDPSQLTDPDYVAQLQANTTTPVYNPAALSPASTSPLPDPAAIVSNYQLPPATYAANIVSAVSELSPLLASPSSSSLFGLLVRYVNLSTIVTSGYEPNLVAAWLLYLKLNRNGRAGTWIENFEATYTALIQPSLDYLAQTPVPWNAVAGGPGVVAAPSAIPLITTLKADATNHLLWELSFIEAALLGYTRTLTWDAAADATYLSGPTGADLDYASTSIDLTATQTIVLGATTASYPVACTFPQAIATVLSPVIALAAASIAQMPGYQSTRPQFRYVYNEFAQAQLVDSHSQFWREFNANLQALLALDPYTVGFACHYTGILNSALNPLASPSAYQTLTMDTASRNRSWTPGSDLLPLPIPSSNSGSPGSGVPATGWTNGVFDAAAFLARPDIQAQTIPIQMAMLNTNQSYATILTLQANLNNAVAATVANAQSLIGTVGVPGWEVETSIAEIVPTGSGGLVLPFLKVDFDQSGYVESPATINIQATNPYIITGEIDWDPAGESGTRTVDVVQNGVVVATSSVDQTSITPFTLIFSALLNLNQGDILQVVVSHNCQDPQNVLPGSTFLGLVDSGAEQTVGATAIPVTANTGGTTTTFPSDAAFPVMTAISIQSDGGILPVHPTVSTPGTIPFVDGVATTTASATGDTVTVGSAYGSTYTVPGQNFTVGGLLYVGHGGLLTQDYSAITANVPWVICVGKAISPDSFIYQPHLPTNYIQNF